MKFLSSIKFPKVRYLDKVLIGTLGVIALGALFTVYKNSDYIAADALTRGFVDPSSFKGSPAERAQVISYIQKTQSEESQNGVQKPAAQAYEVMAFEMATLNPSAESIKIAVHDSCKWSSELTGKCKYAYIFSNLSTQPTSNAMFKNVIDNFQQGTATVAH